MNGFDKYLEFHFGQSGSFYRCLFLTIGQADKDNLNRLSRGFPGEVKAYITFTRVGREDFLAGCSANHQLVKKIIAGEIYL